MPFDKVVDKIAALGVPGLVLTAAIGFSGLAGGAAIVAALATLGGPLGMIGGIGLLVLLGIIAKALSDYGFERVMNGVVARLVESGKSKEDIAKEVNGYWFISAELKRKIVGGLYAAE